MRSTKFIAALLGVCLACSMLTACSEKKDPDFSGCKKVAELSTMEYTFHNVAEIVNDGANILFGINLTYKKAWFEYDGKVKLGIDVNKVVIDKPDENGVVTVHLPQAQIIGQPDVDESTFSDIYSDTGFLASISTMDQTEAFQKAQQTMRESAESNSNLLQQARDRAQKLLKQYVINVGVALNESYQVKFVDA